MSASRNRPAECFARAIRRKSGFRSRPSTVKPWRLASRRACSPVPQSYVEQRAAGRMQGPQQRRDVRRLGPVVLKTGVDEVVELGRLREHEAWGLVPFVLEGHFDLRAIALDLAV